MWTRCRYQMFLSAPPPCLNDHSNLFYSSAAPPLSHTRCRRGTRGTERSGHVHMVRLAILAVNPPPPFSHQVFPYKQPIFTVSSVVPVERWKFIPPTLVQAAPLHFFPCITIRCKFLIIFSLSLTFLALDAFLSNVEF